MAVAVQTSTISGDASSHPSKTLFSHNSKRHSHLRVCSPHKEEVDLLHFDGSFSKLLILQQQVTNKASRILADLGTFKGTGVNSHQSWSWLQFCISLQGVGNDSSYPHLRFPLSLEALIEDPVLVNTHGAQHVILQVWGRKGAGWQQKEGNHFPLLLRYPGLSSVELKPNPTS